MNEEELRFLKPFLSCDRTDDTSSSSLEDLMNIFNEGFDQGSCTTSTISESAPVQIPVSTGLSSQPPQSTSAPLLSSVAPPHTVPAPATLEQPSISDTLETPLPSTSGLWSQHTQPSNVGPYVKIIVQPKEIQKGRYLTDIKKRKTGSISGKHHNSKPTIKIYNLRGPYLIIVLCVTDQHPHSAHAHQLFGGSETVKIVGGMAVCETSDPEFSLSKVGILRVRHNAPSVEQALRERAKARLPQLLYHQMYPYKYGLMNDLNPKSEDMKVIRLAFQVFFRDEQNQGWLELAPVISDPIRFETCGENSERVTLPSFAIENVNPTEGSADGDTVMNITLDEIYRKKKLNGLKVVFYEKTDGSGWKADACIGIREGRLIVVFTPPYGGNQTATDGRVEVKFQVRSTVQSSVPVSFYYKLEHDTSLLPNVTPSRSDTEPKPVPKSRAQRICKTMIKNSRLWLRGLPRVPSLRCIPPPRRHTVATSSMVAKKANFQPSGASSVSSDSDNELFEYFKEMKI